MLCNLLQLRFLKTSKLELRRTWGYYLVGGSGASCRWEELPEDLQKDADFVRDVAHKFFCLHAVFEARPLLREDLQIWKNYIETYSYRRHLKSLCESIKEVAPNHVRSNWDLMMKACISWDPCFHYIDISLQTNVSFCKELCQNSPESKHRIHHSIFFRLVHMLKRSTTDGDMKARICTILKPIFCYFAKHLDSYLSLDDYDFSSWKYINWTFFMHTSERILREALPGWLEAGLPLDPRYVPNSIRHESESFLLVAKHCVKEHKRSSFMNASPELRGDKDFMRGVLERDPSLFSCATKNLQGDYDLAIIAFAKSPSTIRDIMEEDPEFGKELLEQLRHHLQKNYFDQYEGILRVLLWGTYKFNSFDGHLWRYISEYHYSLPPPSERLLIQHAFDNIVQFQFDSNCGI